MYYYFLKVQLSLFVISCLGIPFCLGYFVNYSCYLLTWSIHILIMSAVKH